MLKAEEKYKNLVKNKNVALVGPASSIAGSKNGELIDSHDIVVRLNYAKIQNKEDSGSKTNIIYYAINIYSHKQ